MPVRKRNGGKFRNSREKLRQKAKKDAEKASKLDRLDKKEASKQARLERKEASNQARLEREEGSQQDGKQNKRAKLVEIDKDIYKVSAGGHVRGKLKARKLLNLRDRDTQEKKLAEYKTIIKKEKQAGRPRPSWNKKMTSTSSDDDAEMMAALTSVAVDSAAVMQGAADLAKRKYRKVRGAPKPGKKSRRRLGDSSDEDPELQHYQIRTQDMLHRHLDQTFGAIVGYDSSDDEGNTKEQLIINVRKKRKDGGNGNVVKKGKKQRTLTTGDSLGAMNETNGTGTGNTVGTEDVGIRLFKSSQAPSKPELKGLKPA